MLKIAILGADSSHVEAYTELIHAGQRAQVVALWGADFDQATEKAAALGIPQVAETPAQALQNADAVMVEARYGDDHFPLVQAALDHRLPVYVDKPLTNNFHQAEMLIRQATQQNVPLFSCSPLRYAPEVIGMDATGWISASVAGLSEYPALGERANNVYFYGIHLVEMLSAVFGVGGVFVDVTTSPRVDIATLRYPSGQSAALHFLRGCREIYHLTAYLPDRVLSVDVDAWGPFYPATLDRILTFFETGIAPVAPTETLAGIKVLSDIEGAL